MPEPYTMPEASVIELMEKAYREKGSYARAGKAIGYSRSYIRWVLVNCGKVKPFEPKTSEMVKLHKQGFKNSEIAKLTQTTPGNVTQALKRRGIHASRSRGRPHSDSQLSIHPLVQSSVMDEVADELGMTSASLQRMLLRKIATDSHAKNLIYNLLDMEQNGLGRSKED